MDQVEDSAKADERIKSYYKELFLEAEQLMNHREREVRSLALEIRELIKKRYEYDDWFNNA